jgi:hypothetical protein
MSGLHDALIDLLGYDVDVPDAVPTEENAAICARLGLVVFDATGNLEIDAGTPVVMIIHTRDRYAHAMYVAAHRVGEFLAWNTRPLLSVIVRRQDAGQVRYT